MSGAAQTVVGACETLPSPPLPFSIIPGPPSMKRPWLTCARRTRLCGATATLNSTSSSAPSKPSATSPGSAPTSALPSQTLPSAIRPFLRGRLRERGGVRGDTLCSSGK